MVGRPRIYDRTHQVTTAIQGIFWDLAREKHISWKLALEAGIKLLAQGGDSPNLNKEIIEKHLKIEKHLEEINFKKDEEIDELKKKFENVQQKKETTNQRKLTKAEKRSFHY